MGPPLLQEEVCSPQGSEACFLKARLALGSYRTWGVEEGRGCWG